MKEINQTYDFHLFQDDWHDASQQAERDGSAEQLDRHPRQPDPKGRVEDGQRGRGAIHDHRFVRRRRRTPSRLPSTVSLLSRHRTAERSVLRIHRSHGAGK